MKQNRVQKIIALCMILLLFCTPFFAKIFIITNLHHDCSKTDCPICAEIQIAEAIVQQFNSLLQAVIILFSFAIFIAEGISILYQVNLVHTPVEMKVRIND